MPTYRITLTDGRSEDVDGDAVGLEGESHLVVRRTVLVIGQPRQIVVRRLHASQFIDVTEV